jgi:hypothetical protein
MRQHASGLHLGRDGEGFYISATDRETGIYQSYNISHRHVLQLLTQAAALMLHEMDIEPKP